jgi:hypothetical protein
MTEGKLSFQRDRYLIFFLIYIGGGGVQAGIPRHIGH